MARYKGAVGFEIGTSKLGAYSMEDTLEIFEREGYVKYKDLDQYFKDCYFDFENKLSEKEFIEKCKKNILRSQKYKQFINNEVKMCSKCGKVKPLKSYTSKKNCLFGVNYMCRSCENEYRREYGKTERGKEVNRKKNINYERNHKDKCKENRRRYKKNNKHKVNAVQNRSRMKKYLKSIGILIEDKEKLDLLVSLKAESGITRYDNFVNKFEGVING